MPSERKDNLPPSFAIAALTYNHAPRRGRETCGHITRRGDARGRSMLFAHCLDNDKGPASVRLARLQHRTMRLERRMLRRQARRQNHPRKIRKKSKGSAKGVESIAIPHEVHEDSETFRLRLVIPGYGPSSLTVTVGPFGHFLRIHGKKDASIATNTKIAEDNRFQVAFKVNGKFDTQKLPHGAKATLSNGVLHVSVPKDSTYGQATPVAVSEAVPVPNLPVTASTGSKQEYDDFVDVKDTKTTTTKTTKVMNLQAMTSTNTTDGEECVDGTEDCVDEEMDDEDDCKDSNVEPEVGDNKAMFRRLVAVPGVRLEDVTVEHECEGRILRVTAVRRGALTGYNKDKTFQQTFRLGPIARGIDIAHLAATLDHGVLRITAPRTMTLGLDEKKSKGGKQNKTMQQDETPKRFVIPVTTSHGMADEGGEEDVVAGFESMDLTKSTRKTSAA